jgi:hypothetical protein
MGLDIIKAIGYHGAIINGKPVLVNHYGEVGYDLDWFLADHSGADYKKIAYDLDAFTAVLLRAMVVTEDEGNKLVDKKKLHYYSENQAYDIMYYPSKYLGITKGVGWGRPYAGLFNVEQYLEGGCHYDSKEMTIEDCKIKAQEAKDKAVEVSQSFYKLGLDPNTLTSPVGSMEKSLLKDLDVPTHLDIPPEVNDMAMKCCTGNWVEAFKLGHWDGAYDLDITGAYASVLADLVDLRYGEWVESIKEPEGAVYGFANGIATIDANFAPIFYSNGEDNNYTPNGAWERILTKKSVDFIKKHQLGAFEIEKAYWWLSNTKVKRNPYKGIINYLFKKRNGASKLEDKIIKRCLAGLWGRTLHTRVEYGKTVYGDAFNPVYGAMVETDISLKVAGFILDNNLTDNLLHIAVDGVLLDKIVELSEQDGLGSWRLSHKGGAIVVNSGVAAVEGKEGAEDFAINYNWLLGEIKSKPRAKKYTMSKISPCTLAKAVNSDFKNLGMLEDVKRDIVVGNEAKRFYWDSPLTGGKLLNNHYNSEPMDVALLGLGIG